MSVVNKRKINYDENKVYVDQKFKYKFEATKKLCFC